MLVPYRCLYAGYDAHFAFANAILFSNRRPTSSSIGPAPGPIFLFNVLLFCLGIEIVVVVVFVFAFV